MPENYDHYITKNIKALYKRRLFSPIVYLIIVIVLWHVFSLTDLLFPVHLTDDVPLESAYRNDAANMHTTLTDLKFTGYTRSNFAGTSGYYYYTIRNDECIIVLLSPSTCEEGLPSIDEVKLTGKIKKSSESFHALLKNMAEDLSWTESGIQSKVSGYYISEPDYNRTINTILFTVIFGTGIYAILCLVLYILFIFFPVLSPCCQDLALFGNPKKLLEQAEEELATLPQLSNRGYVYHRTLILLKPLFMEMRSSRSTRLYGFISTPLSISFSGIISVFPIHCISAPTSICISSARKISNLISTVLWITLRKLTTIFSLDSMRKIDWKCRKFRERR